MLDKSNDNFFKRIADVPGGADPSYDKAVKDAESFYAQNEEAARTMFGYPTHNVKLSPITQYLVLLHYNSPCTNNCGDINERGNYRMDTKEVEKKIVGLFADKFGMGDDYWGYVTSGGTESNSCGISMAFNKYPEGTLYFSGSAHYSIKKAGRLYPYFEIPCKDHDELDTRLLSETIKNNYEKTGSPANVVLTYGTTLYGTCDPFDEVIKYLDNEHIPHFIHLDAALFGGIPANQKGAPILTDLKKRGVDSVCVSMHKYPGFPEVHSVFVATAHPWVSTVDYIGQHDTTVSGSRSMPAFALYNHLKELFAEKDEGAYLKNVVFFENALKNAGIEYYRADKANTFVIDCPSDEVCKKYQLSTFFATENGKKVKKAHIIIFTHHRENDMSALVNDLK